MQPRDDLYVFFHMNKTGGTTFTNHINKCYNNNRLIAPMLNDYQKQQAIAENRIYWQDETLENKLKAIIVCGHDANPASVSRLDKYRKLQYLTFFREPSSRLVSIYNYGKHAKMIPQQRSFSEHLAIRGFCNSQVSFFLSYFLGWEEKEIDHIYRTGDRRILISTALEWINDFFFIGLYEDFDDDILEITNLLCLPKVTESYLVTGKGVDEHVRLSSQLRVQIEEFMPMEFEFYRQIKKLRAARRSPFKDNPGGNDQLGNRLRSAEK